MARIDEINWKALEHDVDKMVALTLGGDPQTVEARFLEIHGGAAAFRLSRASKDADKGGDWRKSKDVIRLVYTPPAR